MSQIIYHVGEGSDYRSRVRVGTTTARATPAKSPAEDGKDLQPGHLRSRVGSRCYLSVMTFASARASALLSSGIRIP
jgi:hypothetical protein